jgi:hypothetical protein
MTVYVLGQFAVWVNATASAGKIAYIEDAIEVIHRVGAGQYGRPEVRMKKKTTKMEVIK